MPYEVIIIDQSDKKIAAQIKEWIKKEKTIKTKYVYFNERSSARARNLGIDLATGNICVFLDDDVTLEKDYLKQANIFFNNYKNANGVTGYMLNKETKVRIILKFLRKTYNILFLNERIRKLGFKGVFSGHLFVFKPKKIYKHCQFFIGSNMLIKKEILKTFKFDNKFVKYSYKEDADLTNRIYLKYPETLYFNPNMKIIHRFSPKSRLPNKELMKMKIVYSFYIYLKNHRVDFQFYWSTIGYIIYEALLTLLRILSFKSFFYELQALRFAMKHLDKIKKGNVDFYNFK